MTESVSAYFCVCLPYSDTLKIRLWCVLRSYSSLGVALSRSHSCSFWRRLGNTFDARERRRKSVTPTFARFVHIYSSLFYLTRTLYYYLKVDTFTTALCVDRHLLRRRRSERERRERLLPAFYVLLVEEGRREKDSGW